MSFPVIHNILQFVWWRERWDWFTGIDWILSQNGSWETLYLWPRQLTTTFEFLVEYKYLTKEMKNLEEGLLLQSKVFSHYVEHHTQKHHFVAFIDSNEFIVVKDKTKSISWYFAPIWTLWWSRYKLGSSGHISRTQGGVLANYHTCYNAEPLNRFLTHVLCSNSPQNAIKFSGFKRRLFHILNMNLRKTFSIWFLFNFIVIKVYKISLQRTFNVSKTKQADVLKYFHEIDRKMVRECGYLEMPPVRVNWTWRNSVGILVIYCLQV